MPSNLRPARRGPWSAAVFVFAAACALREARAQDSAPDRPTGPPSPRAHVVSPTAAWSLALAPGAVPDATATFESRLDREARRRGSLTFALLDPDDETAARGRSQSAERIFSRALRGFLDDRAESLARETPGFGDALRWVEGFGFHASAGGGGRVAAAPGRQDLAGAAVGPITSVAPTTPSPFDASVRMRLDAHPRVELRARAGSLTGLVEVPLLEREVRFGLEQPLGRFGRAALHGGHSADQGDWADLVVGIRF